MGVSWRWSCPDRRSRDRTRRSATLSSLRAADFSGLAPLPAVHSNRRCRRSLPADSCSPPPDTPQAEAGLRREDFFHNHFVLPTIAKIVLVNEFLPGGRRELRDRAAALVQGLARVARQLRVGLPIIFLARDE